MLRREEALAKRLARFVGRRAVRRLGGRLVPGFAILLNAVGNERETRALADRAIRSTAGDASAGLPPYTGIAAPLTGSTPPC